MLYWLVSENLLMTDDCQRTLLMISQHWFRYWFGAVRQQAIAWTNVDLDPCRHMASLGHNELIQCLIQFSVYFVCVCRAVFLRRRSRELLDNDELQRLWFLLDKHHTPPLVGDEQMINYEDFLKVSAEAGVKCKWVVVLKFTVVTHGYINRTSVGK